MNYKIIQIVFIIILALITITSVNAQEIEDNDTNLFSNDIDSVEEIENEEVLQNSNTGSFTDLQSEIDEADETINLTRDYTCNDDDSTLQINKKITINGNGHSIDALGKTRIMQVNADHVTINNLTFKNGYFAGTPQNSEAHSAGIYWFGNYSEIKNCFFDSNEVANRYGSGAAIYFEDDNGGVHDILIESTIFKNNKATDKGGAIYFCGDNILINNCVFENNSAVRLADKNAGHDPYGGAIYFDKFYGKNRVVNNSKFISNYIFAKESNRVANGGAIYIQSNVDILNSIFINNSAKSTRNSERGGAIYSYSKGNIINSTFINNSARYGGAIEIRVNECNIENSNFTDNTAYMGAALYSQDCIFTIKNSNFIHNVALKTAGALYNGYETTIIENSLFKDNIAGESAGAVFYELDDDLIIKSSKFINNTAKKDGGAIYYWGSSKFIIEDSLFENNTATSAGAIFSGIYYNNNQNFTVKNSNFTNNKANLSSYGYGGAIYTYCGANRFIIDSKFNDNFAQSEGGAIYWGSASEYKTYENIIINSIFENNNAKYGGAVMWSCPNGEIKNNEYYHNNATYGSAIYLVYGKLNITDSTLLKNHANSAVITCKYTNSTVEAVFKGCDNIINAIYNQNQDISFKNVTYWGVNGEMNTGLNSINPVVGYNENNVYEDFLESNIVINFEIFDENNNLVKTLIANTGIDGKAKSNVDGLMPGKYTVKAIHYDDDYYTKIISSQDSFNVEKINTKIISHDIEDKILTSQNITVQILDEKNNNVANGTATLTFNGKKYTNEVNDGIVTFTNVNLTESGKFISNIEYDGNEYYNSSNGLINITVSKIHTHTYDHNITHITPHEIVVIVTVTDEYNQLLKNGSVELIIIYEGEHNNLLGATPYRVYDKYSYFANLNNGKAKFDIVLPKFGDYFIEAEYYGDDIYYASEDDVELDIEKENTTIKADDIEGKVGETKTITAEIQDQDGNPVYDGKAKLVIGDNEYKANVINGTAKFNNVVLPDKNMTGIIYYLGDDNYTKSNTTFKITVFGDNATNETKNITNNAQKIINNTNTTKIKDKPVRHQSQHDVYNQFVNNGIDTNDNHSITKSDNHKTTGNPIFAILIVLIGLITSFTYNRRK